MSQATCRWLLQRNPQNNGKCRRKWWIRKYIIFSKLYLSQQNLFLRKSRKCGSNLPLKSSALRTANASSGRTTRGITSILLLILCFASRVSKCWMKTSDQGKSPSTKGSVSGQKACGAPGDFHFTWEHTYINTFRKAIKKKDFSQMADHPPPIPLFETPREKKLRDFEKKKSYFFTCDLWVIQVLFYK